MPSVRRVFSVLVVILAGLLLVAALSLLADGESGAAVAVLLLALFGAAIGILLWPRSTQRVSSSAPTSTPSSSAPAASVGTAPHRADETHPPPARPAASPPPPPATAAPSATHPYASIRRHRSTRSGFRPVGFTRTHTHHLARDLVFSVVDVETTDLEPRRGGGIVEIGLVKIRGDGTVLDEFATLINRPGSSLEARSVHEILDEDLVDAPSWGQVWPEVRAFVAGSILVAHNSGFEEKFLAAEIRNHQEELPDLPTLCTLATARRHLDGRAYSLKSLHKTVSGTWRQDEHTALGDARATADLLLWFLTTSPTPMYLEGDVPTEPAQTPDPNCVIRCRPVSSSGLSVARLVDAFPSSQRQRPGDPTVVNAYRGELAAALDDGRLSRDEILVLSDLARRTGLTAPQLNDLHDEAWQQAFTDLDADHQQRSARLRAAEQLGLTIRAEEIRHKIADDAGPPPSPHALLLRSWRVGLVGTSAPLEELRQHALDHGVKVAKRITSTVRFTADDQTAPDSPHLASSRRLGIPVVSLTDATARLEKAIIHAKTEHEQWQAQIAESDEQHRQARAEADAYWRHQWRPREHRHNPGARRLT